MNQHKNQTVVYCRRCADVIASKHDLITVLQLPDLVAAYHIHCYGKRALGVNPGSVPLNGQAIIWTIVVFSSLGLVGFVVSSFNFIWLIIASIAPISRLLSWWLVERNFS